jgi:hypothetical protein
MTTQPPQHTPIPVTRSLLAYLTLLVGRESALLEVRARGERGMLQAWYDTRRLPAACDAILADAQHTDVYVGCAPRVRRSGTRDAVTRCWVLWVDCDTPEAVAALDAFAIAPAAVIASGTATNRHAYWPLRSPISARRVGELNRRLAHALGADSGSVTAATAILRPPGTLNHKHAPPRPVSALALRPWQRVSVAELEQRLPQLPAAPAPSPSPDPARNGGDALLTIAPSTYVRVLTGRSPGRDGKVCCPLHADDTPSLHVYPEPAHGWFCFGCQRGGSIFDLAAALWGLQTRGPNFLELRSRLNELFGLSHNHKE